MHTRRISIGIISALFAASLAAGARADLGGPSNPAAALAQNGSAFTYQGQLRKNGAPVNASCNASFSLYDAATGGAQVGGTVTSATLQVANGLFTIPLDFGWNFNGEARWLETAIGCGEAQATLTPRTALRPAPYAFALPGMRTVPGDTDGGGNPTMNVIGGVVSGAISNTISADSFNSAVGGGSGNVISGTGTYGVISGGNLNHVEGGNAATIGGGARNTAENYYATVGGGDSNHARGIFATVPGGTNNIANGNYSLAAGAGARANHQGTFVWGDATNLPINSGGDNQFIARANGGFAFLAVTGPYTPTIAPGVFITTSTGASLSTAGVWTANGVKFPDGKTQTGAAATPSNVVIVAKSGGHFSTISAALTSITDNSAANRYLVYIAPGTYTETVTMKPFVDIEGAGELATKITQVGSASDTGTVVGASDAELRYLAVHNTGGNTFATGIRNSGTSTRISHVTIDVSSSGVETNGVKNTSASPTLTDVTISVASTGRGLNNQNSSLSLTNVRIGPAYFGMANIQSSLSIKNSVIGGSDTIYGITNQASSGAFTVTIANSSIAGSGNTIWNDAFYATFVGVSQLSGGAVTGGGTVTCVGVFDENYASAGYTTCP